jgi:hypothetical protein
MSCRARFDSWVGFMELNRVSILQYADDTILLFEDNLEQARNLKFLLCLFEEMSGLNINFHKSEVYCLGRAKDRVRQFEEILTCKSGDLPMKYLGIPIDEKRLAVSRWNPIIEKFGKKLNPWHFGLGCHEYIFT